MRKLFVTMMLVAAVGVSGSLMAQDAKKAECSKEKTESCSKKKSCSKDSTCTKKAGETKKTETAPAKK